MDFELSEESRLLQRTVREFVDREVAPRAPSVDDTGEFPRDVFAKLAALGALGVTVPREYGGGGGTILDAAVVMEELSRGCGSTGLSWGAHAILCTHNLHKFSNESQRRRFLPALCDGSRFGAFALTEPGFGSDATSLQTKAVREGKGYRITGSKMFITNAAVAGTFLVFARTSPDAVSLFVVERETPGLEVGKPMEKLGIRGSPTSEITFDGMLVSEENRLGEEGAGVKMMLAALDTERAVLTGLAIGIAQAAFEAALGYAKSRTQFGRPIGEFQMVQEMLAKMAMDLEAGRLLFYQAADLATKGRLKSRLASYAKLYGAEMVNRVTQNALQVFGGYGFIKEFPVERYLRDARLCSLGGGTNEIQKLIIARELLKS